MKSKANSSIQNTLDAVLDQLSRWIFQMTGKEVQLAEQIEFSEDIWRIQLNPIKLILSDSEIKFFNQCNIENAHKTPFEWVALAKGNLIACHGTMRAIRNLKGYLDIEIELNRRTYPEKIAFKKL